MTGPWDTVGWVLLVALSVLLTWIVATQEAERRRRERNAGRHTERAAGVVARPNPIDGVALGWAEAEK